jgi:hypothetical protein
MNDTKRYVRRSGDQKGVEWTKPYATALYVLALQLDLVAIVVTMDQALTRAEA